MVVQCYEVEFLNIKHIIFLYWMLNLVIYLHRTIICWENLDFVIHIIKLIISIYEMNSLIIFWPMHFGIGKVNYM
jgi:hypothetical protein